MQATPMQATKERIPTLRLLGIILLLWAYGMNVHGVLGAWQEAHRTPEQAAREHLEEMQKHPDMRVHAPQGPELSNTGMVLLGVLLAAGVVIALAPVGGGEWCGVWATVGVGIPTAGPRFRSDRRCWQVLDPN